MRFDKSNHTIVITCSECSTLYAELAVSIAEAARISTEHERLVHGISAGKTQGYGITYQATRRASKK